MEFIAQAADYLLGIPFLGLGSTVGHVWIGLAILGIGSIEKRPVVVDNAVVARTTAILTLGFDHRVIDGAVADQFMAQIKKALENWDESRA